MLSHVRLPLLFYLVPIFLNITSLTLTLTHSSLCHHTLAATSTTPRNSHRATSINHNRATSQPSPPLQSRNTTTSTTSRNLHHFSHATKPQPHRTEKESTRVTPQPSPTAPVALNQKRATLHDTASTVTSVPSRSPPEFLPLFFAPGFFVELTILEPSL